MKKIIIQHGKYRGLYEIIILQNQCLFFFIKWWKELSITEHYEEDAIAKICELIKKYKIPQCDIYDWSGDGFCEDLIKENFVEEQFSLAIM